MPIFLDRHDMVESSAKEVAKLHVKDLEVQDKYGVKFLTYWYDAERRTTFCLVDAPDKETADKVHAEAHGHVANEMIAVDLSSVEAFLGRIQDPLSAKTVPINESAFRAIMFTDMVGSIEMTVQLGDTMAVELLRAHDAINPAVFGTLSRLRGKTFGRRHYGVIRRRTGCGRVCN